MYAQAVGGATNIVFNWLALSVLQLGIGGVVLAALVLSVSELAAGRLLFWFFGEDREVIEYGMSVVQITFSLYFVYSIFEVQGTIARGASRAFVPAINVFAPAEGVPRFGSNQGCGVGGGDSLCVSDNLGHGIIVYARLCIYAAEERRCAHGFVRSRYHSGIVVTMRSPLRTPFVPRSASERLFTRLDFPFNMIVSKQ